MKNIAATIYYVLLIISVRAQTIVQQGPGQLNEPEKSNAWDTIAIAAGAITFAALLCYLIYLVISGSKYSSKRKLS